MATDATRLYESLFNHLVMNPCAPSRQDGRIDIVERAIIERVLDVASKLSRLPDNPNTDKLHSLRRTIETCRRVNAGGRISKLSLLTAFRELEGSDMIIIHVASQNAGLLIRRDTEK